MKTWKKRLIYILCAFAVVGAVILPCFAADGQAYILYIADESIGTTYSQPIEINSLNDYLYVYANYDSTTRQVTIYASDSFNAAPYSTGAYMIYTIQLAQYYYADIDITRGNGEYHDYIGYGYVTTRMIFDTTNYQSIDFTYIVVSIATDYSYQDGYTNGYNEGHLDGYDYGQEQVINNPEQYNLYTQAQYNAAQSSSYASGIQVGQNNVINNPNNYGLYNQQQYIDYGNTRFNEGYNQANANNGYSQTDIENAYNQGLQQGEYNNKTLVGIGNVIVSGIGNVFTQFVEQTGIFGVTIASILATAIIILIVYLIFKAVKG